MNQWSFVLAAYALVLTSTGALTVWSLVAMRKAERAADEITRR